MTDPAPGGSEPHIDPQRMMSLLYWSTRLGHAPGEVEAAVAAVGPRADDVAAYLGQRRTARRPRTRLGPPSPPAFAAHRVPPVRRAHIEALHTRQAN